MTYVAASHATRSGVVNREHKADVLQGGSRTHFGRGLAPENFYGLSERECL